MSSVQQQKQHTLSPEITQTTVIKLRGQAVIIETRFVILFNSPSSRHFSMASICILSSSACRSSVIALVQLNQKLRETSLSHDNHGKETIMAVYCNHDNHVHYNNTVIMTIMAVYWLHQPLSHPYRLQSGRH